MGTSKKIVHYPVVLFVYKRLSSTATLLASLAAAGIRKVYVFSDGPKCPLDQLVIDQVRAQIKLFATTHPQIQFILTMSPTNRGLKTNIVEGLSDVFAKEDAAIILEDDCLPHPDFFPFVSQMLTKYHDDRRVMSISGTSVGKFSHASYDFSRYQLCWGWATWRRSWKLYKPKISELTQLKTKYLSPISKWYWQNIFSLVSKDVIQTWDYQWTHLHLLNESLAIIPSSNLISNVGFDKLATNTRHNSSAANMPSQPLAFPLTDPSQVCENPVLTRMIEHKFYFHPTAVLGLVRYLLFYYWGTRS